MKKVLLSAMAIAIVLFTSCKSDNIIENQDSKFVLDATDFKGTITEGTVTLDPSLTYKLTGGITVNEGATLTIPAGTRIEAIGSPTSCFMLVARGATINVQGTAAAPVVMTASDKRSGAWGGLVICGDAVTNVGTDVISEVGGLQYGGSNNADSSGSIRYLRVEYTGSKFTSKKEYNGISLFGVGSGTTFEYVSSVNGGDDGIEFYGGAVNANHLVSINSEDDSVDFADGFTGTLDYVYIKGVTKAGFEGSNNGEDGARTPVTTTTVSNVSIVDGDLGSAEGAIYYKEGGGNITYSNVYVDGISYAVKVKSEDVPAKANITAGNFVINNIQFANITDDVVYNEGTDANVTVGTNVGAGDGADLPTWAAGWAE
jgi:hypothetical protein